MDYHHRLAFRQDDMTTVQFLDKYGFKYKTSSCGIAVLEILESDEKWPVLKKFLERTGRFTIDTAIFTKEEMKNAEWYTVRSKWRWEYPKPDDDFGYLHGITYTGSCPMCGANVVQIGNFRVRRSPKWNSKSFLMINWIHDVLFTSTAVKETLEQSDLRGFHFEDVLNTKGTAPIDDIYQLYVETKLPAGLVTGNDTIKDESTCEMCGVTKYVGAGRGYIFKKETFENIDVDIAVSDEIFGGGYSVIRQILISKRFYETIILNKLDKQLVIEPVILV